MFKQDLALEEQFYNNIFKPWLNSRGNDSIFVRFDSSNIIYESLQKKNDIDVVLDNGKENIALSLKTVRKVYGSIFFETISNCNTGSPGWGLYSKADFIIYSMRKSDNSFISRCFKITSIPHWDDYPKGWGQTFDDFGQLMYKTEGHLIPWKDFKHHCLF